MTLNRPAIAPIGESVCNTEFFRRLAAALGRTEPRLFCSDETLLRTALNSGHPAMDEITFERLWHEGFVRLNLPQDWRPFANGGFPTPTKKARLYSDSLRERGLDPLPGTGDIRQAKGDQLQLITGKTLNFLNSSYAHMAHHCKREGRLFVEVHPEDAAKRGLSDGDLVRVSNDQGSVTADCRVSTRVRPGVVWMPFGGIGDCQGNTSSVNVLTPEEPTDWGGGSGFYDAFVDLERL